MKVLMLGNSFTFANNMPEILSGLIDAEVVQHTRGGGASRGAVKSKDKVGWLDTGCS